MEAASCTSSRHFLHFRVSGTIFASARFGQSAIQGRRSRLDITESVNEKQGDQEWLDLPGRRSFVPTAGRECYRLSVDDEGSLLSPPRASMLQPVLPMGVESVVVAVACASMPRPRQLRRNGVDLAIDDFATPASRRREGKRSTTARRDAGLAPRASATTPRAVVQGTACRCADKCRDDGCSKARSMEEVFPSSDPVGFLSVFLDHRKLLSLDVV